MKTLIAAAIAAAFAMPAAWAWDQQDNRYRVAIDAAAKRATVEADVWVDGRTVALYGVQPVDKLPNGQADFIERIEAAGADGKPIAVTNKGEGDFELAQGDRRVRLRYTIRLEHDRYAWPGGSEEVLYHTDEGLMSVGYTLFVVPVDKMHGNTQVEFDLPAGWQARTPWKPAAGGKGFVAGSRRELVDNALFLGTAQVEQFETGGVTLSIVYGKRYWPQRQVFREMLERQLQTYVSMFGRPLQDRYLLVINQGDSGDGGAFMASFSQYMRGDANAESRFLWGRVLSHELLHFWNGHTLVPADGKEEWFKEGVTDYFTIATMARNGLLDKRHLLNWLENLARGQTVARQLQGLKMPTREAAADKHRNWLLVYGGGSIAALALDVELRRATGDRHGLHDVMRAMFAEFGQPGKRYALEDIVRVTKAVTGQDVEALLRRIVADPTPYDLAPVFAGIGLQLENYIYLEQTLINHPAATLAQKKRFADIFGMPF